MRHIRRELERHVLEAARSFPAVVLTGPRRAGKTWLLRRLFPEMSYFLLEGPDIVARLRPGARVARLPGRDVTAAQRSPLSPAVPTFKEQGLAAIDAVGWAAIYARAGTPKPLIDRLSAAIVETLRRPEIRERFLSLGVEPTGTTPEELAVIMAADTARWAPIIKAWGFTLE